ncbi:MAG: hypothetical protein ACOYK6_00545 [Chthoniobacterales bacterium]
MNPLSTSLEPTVDPASPINTFSSEASNVKEARSEQAPHVIPFFFDGFHEPVAIDKSTQERLAVRLSKQEKEFVVLTAPNKLHGRIVANICNFFGNNQKIAEKLRADLRAKYTNTIADKIFSDDYYNVAETKGLSVLEIERIYKVAIADKLRADLRAKYTKDIADKIFSDDCYTVAKTEGLSVSEIEKIYKVADNLYKAPKENSTTLSETPSNSSEPQDPLNLDSRLLTNNNGTNDSEYILENGGASRSTSSSSTTNTESDTEPTINSSHKNSRPPSPTRSTTTSEDNNSTISANRSSDHGNSPGPNDEGKTNPEINSTTKQRLENRSNSTLNRANAQSGVILRKVISLEDQKEISRLWSIAGKYREHFKTIQDLTQNRDSLSEKIKSLQKEISLVATKNRESQQKMLLALSTDKANTEKELKDLNKNIKSLTDQRDTLFATINAKIKILNSAYSFDSNGNLLDEKGEILTNTFTISEQSAVTSYA